MVNETKDNKLEIFARVIVIYMMFITYLTIPALAWYDGGLSGSTPNNPLYGQHDDILQKAIDMLPPETKQKINTISMYYGTELPDCSTRTGCLNDQRNHRVFYYANGSIQSDIAALRSEQEYNLAKSYLQNGDEYNFSLRIGTMGHYISDLSVFAHTMGHGTAWGPAVHEAEYEQYAEQHLDLWDTYFDGKFERTSAYDAALAMAKETTFDDNIYTNVWMDNNYNWSDPNFISRTRYLINYNVNILADVIYTIADTNPPASITNIKIQDRGKNRVDLTWKDPEDIDFEKVIIYIKGKFKTDVPKGKQYYNTNKNKLDKIGIHTVDANGNINQTWVSIPKYNKASK